jgi:bifunctional non-homologous end joining protein LigD
MPHKIKPMLATLTDSPFDNPAWIFEIKHDGYRAIAEIQGGSVELYSRNLNSFNVLFSPIAESLGELKYDMILDGEIVLLDNEGRSKFQLIQNYQRTGKGNLVYYVFDLLYYDGYDLRELPLLKRKELLQKALTEMHNVKYSDHITEYGREFYKAAEQNKLEGIIAKLSDSEYQTGKRTREWLKIKIHLEQEAIICGFTAPKGSRKNFGALILGVYNEGELTYIGHIGGGFNEAALKEVKKKLDPLVKKNSPFNKKIKTNTKVTWVEPKLVCQVTFSEWTDEGLMRHPVFLGLREDKKPGEVTMELPESKPQESEQIKDEETLGESGDMEKEVIINRHKLKLTNLDKIFWPEEKYTKGDVIEYYRKISKYMLPYLKDRPESMLRHPNGINGKSFFQKNVNHMPPEWVKTEKIYSEHTEDYINYLICNDEATLVFMANLGCIEINPWFSRIQSQENPDYLVIDLDPEEIDFEKVIETALGVKKALDIAGAKSYCKTSGATGLHVYVPLKAKYDYDVAKDFAHVIGQIVNSWLPDITSLERSPSKRKKKVYLDYLQNRKGQTLAAPYSIRPKPGATVSTPLKWEEVKPGLHPSDFNIKNIFKRLEKTGDLFKPVLGAGIDLEKCIRNLEKKRY